MTAELSTPRITSADRSAHLAAFHQLRQSGRMHDAAAQLGRALDLRAWVALPFHGSVPLARVLVLQSILAGNALIHRFLDDKLFAVHILLVEFWQPDLPLPEHDLVLNAIGDADVRGDALAQAERILATITAPVLNAPATVRLTSRAQNAARLRLLPGVRTAHTLRVQRDELGPDTLPELLERHSLQLPILLRAPGFHMGQNCLRLDRFEDLPISLAQLPGDEILLVEHLPTRSGDGWCRKYRVLFLDGQMYPVHLAVSSDWKVHFFSAEMAANAAHRLEDARFLAAMDEVLGSAVLATLQRIQRALDLDYGGIDFGLDFGDVVRSESDSSSCQAARSNAAPRILLFEANANMAVLRPPDDPLWDYRRVAVDRIYSAFHAMLRERSASARCAIPARC